ncbi:MULTISPECIES: DUF1488 domain-containing protein [unclassified Vibrio]|uniref:DUF1488 domain-containing protein n=1 Tax=Vibrio sp. HB236076 TaxID=3232307 RepID=A0AB39HFX5_9VIBR|nr:DUF1488 domain-containing protein [Vibrio sp. HB161653]MDP5255637.1 DUF1488 domain-containing protein [Vibrio sp. HB161653]
MNQSVLFPDQCDWQEALGIITFPAQCQGALIECFVAKSTLEHHLNTSLDTQAELNEAFEQLRFDLEDIAEQKILDDDFDLQGRIEIAELN